MNGKYNPKTKRYEDIYGRPLERINEDLSLDIEDREELRRMNKIQAEGGTYLERYARELGVKGSDLWRDILNNNDFNRIMAVKTYEEFKMLKQTLVEEKSQLKYIFNNIMNITGFTK